MSDVNIRYPTSRLFRRLLTYDILYGYRCLLVHVVFSRIDPGNMGNR